MAQLDDKVLAALESEESKGQSPVQLQTRIEKAERAVKSALDRARVERDVVKTLCLNDKLGQLGVVRRMFADRTRDAHAEGQSAVLSALGARSDQILAESNQCVGEEAGFLGSSSVEVQVDDGEASSELPKGSSKPSQQPASRKGPMGGEIGPAGPPVAARPVEDPGATDLAWLGQRVNALKERIFRDKTRIRLLAMVPRESSIEDAARRGELLKGRIVRGGIPADRVIVEVRRGEGAGISVVAEPMVPAAPQPEAPKRTEAMELEPIKGSLFEIARPLDVPRGSSAMLALYAGTARGEVVYYYDAESTRGDASFPFRAVRMRNPTGSTLESGPVSVLSEGRFLGEGVTDPIPAGSWVFVPFALDRLIVAEREVREADAVAKIVSARRGIFTTEVQHSRVTRVRLYNRAEHAAKVYLRHTLAPGYSLARSPAKAERIGGAQLFLVELPASGKLDAEIVETTTLERSTDVRSDEGAKLLAAYVATGEADPRVKAVLGEVLGIAAEIGKLQEQLGARREQQKEYRERLRELHVEVVTLKTVKSSAALLAALEKKLAESNERVSKITAEIVALQEKIMVARIRLQDALAELRLDAPSTRAGEVSVARAGR